MKLLMRPKWQLLLLGVLALEGVVGVFLLIEASPAPQPGLTEENAFRLRAGMTEQQVRALLGLPKLPHLRPTAGVRIYGEKGKTSVIAEYDANGILTYAEFHNHSKSYLKLLENNESFLDRIIRWLRH
ncbi:MAG: hypothetical protein HY040_01135 [Planctomycetes bacterium]|nr:hypothetical protein [Planctomycetota bacterium]